MVITKGLPPKKVIHDLRSVDQQADHFPLIVGQTIQICCQREISIDIRSRFYDLQRLISRFGLGLCTTGCNKSYNNTGSACQAQ